MNMDESTNKATPIQYQKVTDQSLDHEKKLIEEMKRRFNTDKKDMDTLVAARDNNVRLYYARYIDKNLMPAVEADDYMMVPKLFSNLETVIPVVTRKSPEFNVDVFPATKKNKKNAKLLRQDIEDKWQMSEENNGWQMQPKQQQNLRRLFNQKTMIYIPEWNIDEGRMIVRPVKIKDIIAPLTKVDTVQELPYYLHRCEHSLGDMKAKWPDKAEELTEALPDRDMDDDSVLEYWKYWKKDSVAYWYKAGNKDVLLGQDQNPYYDFGTTDEMSGISLPGKNHFTRPMLPIIIDTDIRMDEGLIGATSLVEISESVVKAIDTDKNVIRKNNRLAAGLVVVDESFGTSEEVSKLDFSGRKTVQLKGIQESVGNHIEILTGRPVDNATVQSLDDNRNIMDENTGANDVIRGEENAGETLGGQQLRKQSALTRNEPLFQLGERNAQQIGNWYAQFTCLFGDKEQIVQSASKESSKPQMLSSKIFDGEVTYVITVKDGSTTPIDKRAVQAQAFEEATAGLIATVDYHRALERDDPEGLAQRAIMQLNAPLDLIAPKGNVDLDAVLHIRALLKGEDPGLFQTPDPEQMAAHLSTHAQYRDGDDVDEDLIGDKAYRMQDIEIQEMIKMHEQQELEQLKIMKEQLMMQQQAVADKNKLLEQGIDPTALEMAKNMPQIGSTGGMSQPNTQDINQAPEQPSEAELAGMG